MKFLRNAGILLLIAIGSCSCIIIESNSGSIWIEDGHQVSTPVDLKIPLPL